MSDGDYGDRMVDVQTVVLVADMKTNPHTVKTFDNRALSINLLTKVKELTNMMFQPITDSLSSTSHLFYCVYCCMLDVSHQMCARAHVCVCVWCTVGRTPNSASLKSQRYFMAQHR